MGYTTNFEGSFKVDPPLTPNQVAYLVKFASTRRVEREATRAERMQDDTRLLPDINLPSVGIQGSYFVGGLGDFGQDYDRSVTNHNRPPADQPSLWCQWIPMKDGTRLEWDGNEKFSEYVEWLEYLIKHFFHHWNRTLNGRVVWQGEEAEDIGVIRVIDNVVESEEFDLNKYLAKVLPMPE